MAIIPAQEETLISLHGTRNIILDDLIDKATDIRDSFNRHRVNGNAARPIYMNDNKELFVACQNQYTGGYTLISDVSNHAFGQACDYIGVPAQYMKKCYERGLDDLVSINIDRQLQAKAGLPDGLNYFSNLIALESEGVCEAFVTNKYNFGFQTPEVLETIKEYMPETYLPNQAYLSKQRLHIRFIDFDHPEYVGGEKMSVGFTVGTSDIGKSALQVRFFLYKFACQNGIVSGSRGGILYKQKHIGDTFDTDNIMAFRECFNDIALLREEGLELIRASQNRLMSESEMAAILDTCRKYACNIGETEKTLIIALANERYGHTKWGLINGITEVAQSHTLDTRLAYESWAGRLLQSA